MSGYDDVTLSLIPSNAQVVGGYVGGMFPTYDSVVRDFPHAAHVSIAISASEITHNGRPINCLDTEPGDAVPSQDRAWVLAEKRLGEAHPCIYSMGSWMPQVKADTAGLGALYWVAIWDGNPTIPAGFDAKQWTDHALGRSLDADTFSTTFLIDLGLRKAAPSNLVSKAKMAKWKGAEAATLHAIQTGCVAVYIHHGDAAVRLRKTNHCEVLYQRAHWFRHEIRTHRVR